MHALRIVPFVLVIISLIGITPMTAWAAGLSELREQLDTARLAYEVNPTPEQMAVVEERVDAYLAYRKAHPDELLPVPRPPPGSGPTDDGVLRAVAGPDGFGYRAIDSLEAGGPVFDFIDISATGQKVVEGDQKSSASSPPGGIGAPITLPLPFTLYGVQYTQMNMCSNGYLTTDPADLGPDLSNDCPLPDVPSSPPTTTGARLYPLHDDLDLEAGIGAGYYEYFDSCPRRSDTGCEMGCHVFMWDNVSHFSGGAASPQWDMEALLYDNGDIVFQIGAGDPNEGSSSTTGIQSESFGDGTTNPDFGLTYACNTASSIQGDLAIRFFVDTNSDGFTDGYVDSDGDGTADRCDDCPSDANKVNPGACGCGVADDDTDGDGVPDCLDDCPNDANKLEAGLCGCGTPDMDTDGDGAPDCLDGCPNDANKLQAGLCGCASADVDSDGDGVDDACTPVPAGSGSFCPFTGMMTAPMTLLGIGLMRRRKHGRPR